MSLKRTRNTDNALTAFIVHGIKEGGLITDASTKVALEKRLKDLVIAHKEGSMSVTDIYKLRELVTFILEEYVYAQLNQNDLTRLCSDIINTLSGKTTLNEIPVVTNDVKVTSGNNNVILPADVVAKKAQTVEIYIKKLKEFIRLKNLNVNMSLTTFKRIVNKFKNANPTVSTPSVNPDMLYKAYNRSL